MSVFDGNTPRRNVEPWPEDRVPTNNLERLIASAAPYIKKERDEAERARADAATRCRAEGGNTSDNKVSDLAAKAPAAQAVDADEVTRLRSQLSEEIAGARAALDKFKDPAWLAQQAAPEAMTSEQQPATQQDEDAKDAALTERELELLMALQRVAEAENDGDTYEAILAACKLLTRYDAAMSAHQAKKGQDHANG